MTPCPSFWQELIDQPDILGLASRKRLAGKKNVAASIEPHQHRLEDMHAINGGHSIGDEKYAPRRDRMLSACLQPLHGLPYVGVLLVACQPQAEPER
jgi:hypothetical protein